MSSYNLNTILKSCVSEQAYLPFKLPESWWVCSVGSKGLLESLLSRSKYLFFREEFFCRNFLARFVNVLSSSSLIVIRCIENGVHCLFYRIANYPRFLFGFKHPLFECFAFFFFFN